MHIRKKLFSILSILAMTIVALLGDLFPGHSLIEPESARDTEDVLTIWYTDAYLEEYIRNAAVVYEEKTGVKVVSTRVSGLEYLEQIQKATIDDGYGPDLFVLSNESLEKAYLSGLCYELKDSRRVLNSTYFPEVSLDAISYSDYKLGYPLFFDCSIFLYNKTLLDEIVTNYNENAVNSNSDYGEGSTEEETTTEETTTEFVPVIAEEILPTSIVEITNFALNYNLPEGCESYFKWCVSDVLYDYWFAGAYLDVGGEKGDIRDEIDVYNTESMYCLNVFQDFKEFFSMDLDKYTYDDLLTDFEAGKILFIVADTNVINKLEADKKSEENPFAYEYGITSIGMLNDTLKSKGLSVTKLVAVNGLSENKELAEDFAKFLSVDYSSNLYSRTGKLACNYQKDMFIPRWKMLSEPMKTAYPSPRLWRLPITGYSAKWYIPRPGTAKMSTSF